MLCRNLLWGGDTADKVVDTMGIGVGLGRGASLKLRECPVHPVSPSRIHPDTPRPPARMGILVVLQTLLPR